MKLLATLVAVLPALALAAPAPAPVPDDGAPDLSLGPAMFNGETALPDGGPFNGAIFEVPQGANNFASFNQLPLLLDGKNGRPRPLNVNGKSLYFGIGQPLNIDFSRLNTGSLCQRVQGLQVPAFKAKYPNQFNSGGGWWSRSDRKHEMEEREAKPEPQPEAQPEASPEHPELEERFLFGLIGGIITGLIKISVGLVSASLSLVLGLVRLSFGLIASTLSILFGITAGITGVVLGPIGCNIYPQQPYWPPGHCLWLPGGLNVTYGGCYTPPDDSYEVIDNPDYDNSYQVWENEGTYYPVVTYDQNGNVQRWVPQ